jgi:hypothetical protein
VRDAPDKPIRERAPARHQLRTGLAVWLVLSAVGVGIVVIPDEGTWLFPLSETHRISWVDGVGIIFLVVGWVSYLVPLWSHRVSLWRPGLWGSSATLGAAILAWSVVTDNGAWWAIGILILVLAQIAPSFPLLYEATRGQ